MTIANFNPEEFAKNLAQQATDLIPKDLNEINKNYIINKVYEFCVLAGNALNQDNTLKLNSEQGYLICQFIGEWTFHKSIDTIRSNIPTELRDGILQQVAFAIFETAKNTQVNKTPQEQAVIQVENIVKDSYEKCVRQLAQSGKLGNSNVDNLLKISNLEDMAKTQYEQAQKDNKVRTGANNDRLIRLAAIALMLKSFPGSKVNTILSNMDPETAKSVRNFMNQPNLKKQLDPQIAAQYLTNLSKSVFSSLSRTTTISKNEYIKNLKNLYSENEIMAIIKNERSFLKNFIFYCIKDDYKYAFDKVPTTYVSNITYQHLRQKLIKANS